jgi:hypothetical protein
VVEGDVFAAAEDEGLLDDVFQLADVAGEVVLHEAGKDVGGDAGDAPVLKAVEAGDQVID